MIIQHGGNVTITVPTSNQTSSPTGVMTYLASEGWFSHYVNGCLYFKKSDLAGDFTWEQALLYTAVLKMNLGGV